MPLLLVGGIATAVLVCGGAGATQRRPAGGAIPPHILFAAVTALGFVGNLWAAYADGLPLMVALAIAIAAIYGQVTVNDIMLARYTADAWRGRVYAVRYFLLFISAGVAIGMISVLHEHGGFSLVLAVNAGIALAMFVATVGARVAGHQCRERASAAAQPAE